jgi:biopolymer transport protein ExbB/TolQ
MNTLTDAFYWVSTGLLVPVMILLLLGFISALCMLGSFYGYFSDRRKFKKEVGQITDKNRDTPLAEIDFTDRIQHHPTFQHALTYANDNHWVPLFNSNALADFEINAEKQLEKTKTLMRVGPMLGLMGTLIPMGPALVGLATGDIATMAMNMQVAFSTTVIGIFLGGTGFMLHSVRKRWFTDDFYKLQFIIDLAQHEQTQQ